MEKIIVLGEKGMLGQMVVNYFGKKNQIVLINQRYTYENRWNFINEIRSVGPSLIINCIGKIKQKSNDLHDLLWSNTTLPLDLQAHIGPRQFLIHPSTDCVFSGALSKGKYTTSMKSDAKDEYGWSKYLGECALKNTVNSMVIRVSIIGPDLNTLKPKGLFGWFLSNSSGANLRGFTNHYWKGITTLEWCIQLEKLIQSNSIHAWAGKILQLGTNEIYTKREMLDIFQKVYQTDYSIEPFNTEVDVNRCLQADIVSPNLHQQIEDLYNYKF